MAAHSDGQGTGERSGPEAAEPAPDLSAIGRQGDLPLLWLRAPIVLLIGWWTMTLAAAAQPTCFLDGIDLAFHEAGHLFLVPFGETIHILGGTLGQLAVPALLVGYFLKRRQPFSAAFALFWLGQNFVDISVYMGDARAMALPLVGGGEHDWTSLFYTFGLLSEESVATVSRLTHHLGVMVMIAGFGWSAFYLLPGSVRASVCDSIYPRS